MKTRSFVTGLALLLLASFAASAEGRLRMLDGNTYVGTMSRPGASDGSPDEFVFEKGLFHTKGHERFGAGAYKVVLRGNAMTFMGETKPGKEGRIKWFGGIIGDRLEATAIWYNAAGQPLVYVLKGALKK